MLNARSDISEIPVDHIGFADLLKNMLLEFDSRFEDFRTHKPLMDLFANPFTRVEPEDVEPEFQMEVIELQTNSNLRDKFNSKPLPEFYQLCLPKEEFPRLYSHAIRMLCLFGSTYRCEQLFSSMKFTKNKYHSRLTDGHLEECLRLSASEIRPDIDNIVRKKQCQVSH